MNIIDDLKQKIKGKGIKVVFPEGEDLRIIRAAVRLNEEELIKPVILGDIKVIKEISEREKLDLSGLEIKNPTESEMENYIEKMIEIRKGKEDYNSAKEKLSESNYLGTMMVYLDEVKGMVSGAIHSTAETVRPALQIVKTRAGVSKVSGLMLLLGKNGEKYIFSDVAVNVDPSGEELAEIAIEAARIGKLFDIEPKVALLSYSTKGSASGEKVDKVLKALEIAKQKAPNLEIDGELQFDAAISETVGSKKVPNSKIAGKANVFIFPDINAGNIGYKIAQRLGGFEAIGPILGGLAKPIFDLSRGCNEEDIYKLSIITAAQCIK